MNTSRGALIVFEGIDCAGKSTQVEQLFRNLSELGRSVRVFKFPDINTTIGTIIAGFLSGNQELSDISTQILFTANRWESNNRIQMALMDGRDVIIDRYSYSGIAYGYVRSKEVLSIDHGFKWEKGLVAPDIVLQLDADPSELAKRPGYGCQKEEYLEFQVNVRNAFTQVKNQVKILTPDIKWMTFDSTLDKNDLSTEILDYTEEAMKIISIIPMKF